jgi:hypothetical protein
MVCDLVLFVDFGASVDFCLDTTGESIATNRFERMCDRCKTCCKLGGAFLKGVVSGLE